MVRLYEELVFEADDKDPFNAFVMERGQQTLRQLLREVQQISDVHLCREKQRELINEVVRVVAAIEVI